MPAARNNNNSLESLSSNSRGNGASPVAPSLLVV